MGVSEQLLFKAIASVENMSVLDVQHRLMGNRVPTLVSYAELSRGDGNNSISNPFPFALCYALDENLESVSVSTLELLLGLVRDWQLEWKWDGIRAQLVYRQGQGWLWSRGEELINDSFPELQRWLTLFTEPMVLDGELLVWQGHRPGTFQEMQRRLGRKRVGKKLLEDCPVVFMVYDLLELGGEDLRGRCTAERRQLLEGLLL